MAFAMCANGHRRVGCDQFPLTHEFLAHMPVARLSPQLVPRYWGVARIVKVRIAKPIGAAYDSGV
jgi:hypothetical protein